MFNRVFKLFLCVLICAISFAVGYAMGHKANNTDSAALPDTDKQASVGVVMPDTDTPAMQSATDTNKAAEQDMAKAPMADTTGTNMPGVAPMPQSKDMAPAAPTPAPGDNDVTMKDNTPSAKTEVIIEPKAVDATKMAAAPKAPATETVAVPTVPADVTAAPLTDEMAKAPTDMMPPVADDQPANMATTDK